MEIPGYVISLMRAPERWDNVSKQLHNQGFLNVYRMEAIDGKNLTQDMLKSLVTPRCLNEVLNGRSEHVALGSINSVACFLSHRKAWKIGAENGTVFYVFEDDMRFGTRAKEELDQEINDFLGDDSLDILSFGWSQKIHGKCIGAVAYMVKSRCVPILIQASALIDCHVDWYINLLSELGYISVKYTSPSFYHLDPQIESTLNHLPLKRSEECASQTNTVFLAIGGALIGSFLVWYFVFKDDVE